MSDSRRFKASRLCAALHPEVPENICAVCDLKIDCVWSSLHLLRWMGRPVSPEVVEGEWEPFTPTEALGFLVPTGLVMQTSTLFLRQDIGVRRKDLEALIAYLEVLSKFTDLISNEDYVEFNAEARVYLRDLLNTDWFVQQQANYGGRQLPKPSNT